MIPKWIPQHGGIRPHTLAKEAQPMRIDGKIVGGYVLICDCGEAFALERIGISVECPACGHTELGPEVALGYYARRAESELHHQHAPAAA